MLRLLLPIALTTCSFKEKLPELQISCKAAEWNTERIERCVTDNEVCFIYHLVGTGAGISCFSKRESKENL